jgi:hypothetical protein
LRRKQRASAISPEKKKKKKKKEKGKNGCFTPTHTEAY